MPLRFYPFVIKREKENEALSDPVYHFHRIVPVYLL